MQLSKTDQMALDLVKKLEEFFGDKIDTCVISNVVDDEVFRSFRIDFAVYEYFTIYITYDQGYFGSSIPFRDSSIGLRNSQNRWDGIDISLFLEELQSEIELRIPDKFLKARGWL